MIQDPFRPVGGLKCLLFVNVIIIIKNEINCQYKNEKGCPYFVFVFVYIVRLSITIMHFISCLGGNSPSGRSLGGGVFRVEIIQMGAILEPPKSSIVALG